MSQTDHSPPLQQTQQIPQSMRAVQIAGPRSIQIVEVPVPNLGPGEVLVRMEGCGICGSNLPVWQGRPWFEYPREPGEPGHEGWGTVVAVGTGVSSDRVRPGDRVVTLSNRALAEYDVVASNAVVPLPTALHGMDVPGEPLGCVMNALHRSDIQRGHTVAIVGVGFLGAVLIQLAVRAGARVFAFSRRPFAAELGRTLGAELSLSTDEVGTYEIAQRVAALTDGRGCDRVIEAVGLQSTLDLATELTCIRGRLIIAGYHQDGPRMVDVQKWNWRGIDVINAHERDTSAYVAGMRAAIDALASGALDLGPLLAHRYQRPIESAAEAFALLEDRPDGFLKAEVML